jgi:glucosamine--fructose-6-phosphate aminotransferase (isomerizing)
MCGIFAYINYLTPRTRREVLEFLIKGLQRLEYRGYDSAGVAIDGDVIPNVIKQTGKVIITPFSLIITVQGAYFCRDSTSTTCRHTQMSNLIPCPRAPQSV